MVRSKSPDPGRLPEEAQAAPSLGRIVPDGAPGSAPPNDLVESWDPSDDEKQAGEHREVQWNWHGRNSWGRRAVAAFPMAGILLAAALFIYTTSSAQGTIDQVQSVVGTGGATLVSSAPPTDASSAANGGQLSDYQGVTFTQPNSPGGPIQGSTSRSLPPYAGWEANGSAGPDNGLASVSGGLLHVGVRWVTTDFRGWFLTTTGATPASCVFQFSAASPPPVYSLYPKAVGELVMAVQTSDTVTTGDINYVFVAENVTPSGHRNLTVGYSKGHLSHAAEHILKQVPWRPGALQVAIQTDGNSTLDVWVNGSLFYSAYLLQLGITPPFQPYLEVQARQATYTVAYRGYSSVCQPDVVLTGLPTGSVARLAGQKQVAEQGSATFPAFLASPPMVGALTLSLPGNTRPVHFAPHTYWPGTRYSFAPGT